MEIFDVFMTLLVITLISVLISAAYEISVRGPLTAENAKQICIEQGFDYAEDHTRVIFSTEPLNVKCGIVGYEKIYVNLEDNIPVEVS